MPNSKTEDEEVADDDIMPLSRVAQRTFASSPQQSFRQIVAEEDEVATFDPDRIFVGWSLGGKEQYQELVKRFERQLRAEGMKNAQTRRREAVQQALRKFPEVVGERRGEVFIDRSEADLTFDGGERGAGKSWNLRGRTNREALADVTCCLIDPEHEYVSNNMYQGIQSNLANLRPGESPQPIDTKVLMPYFVHKARQQADMPERGYDYVDVFKFEFHDLDPNDLDFLITRNFKDHPDFGIFVRNLETKLRQGNIRGWDDVIDVARQLQEEDEFMHTNQGGRVRQIRSFLEHNYKKWGFLGADKKVDLERILNEYNTVVLSLNDNEETPDNLHMKELYVAFFIKRLRALREQDRVPRPIDLVIDEAHRYIPAHTEPQFPPSKQEVRRVIKRDRKRGFRISMASQEPTDVAGKNFLNQTKHFFIPQNMKPKPRKALLKKAQVHRSGDESRNKWGRIFEAMSEHLDHGWLYVNAETKNWEILEVPSPISYHRE